MNINHTYGTKSKGTPSHSLKKPPVDPHIGMINGPSPKNLTIKYTTDEKSR